MHGMNGPCYMLCAAYVGRPLTTFSGVNPAGDRGIGGDSIEARRHVPPHFLRAGGTQWSVPPRFFWNENILNTHYYG